MFFKKISFLVLVFNILTFPLAAGENGYESAMRYTDEINVIRKSNLEATQECKEELWSKSKSIHNILDGTTSIILTDQHASEADREKAWRSILTTHLRQIRYGLPEDNNTSYYNRDACLHEQYYGHNAALFIMHTAARLLTRTPGIIFWEYGLLQRHSIKQLDDLIKQNHMDVSHVNFLKYASNQLLEGKYIMSVLGKNAYKIYIEYTKEYADVPFQSVINLAEEKIEQQDQLNYQSPSPIFSIDGQGRMFQRAVTLPFKSQTLPAYLVCLNENQCEILIASRILTPQQFVLYDEAREVYIVRPTTEIQKRIWEALCGGEVRDWVRLIEDEQDQVSDTVLMNKLGEFKRISCREAIRHARDESTYQRGATFKSLKVRYPEYMDMITKAENDEEGEDDEDEEE